jgi:hypothetical protein
LIGKGFSFEPIDKFRKVTLTGQLKKPSLCRIVQSKRESMPRGVSLRCLRTESHISGRQSRISCPRRDPIIEWDPPDTVHVVCFVFICSAYVLTEGSANNSITKFRIEEYVLRGSQIQLDIPKRRRIPP